LLTQSRQGAKNYFLIKKKNSLYLGARVFLRLGVGPKSKIHFIPFWICVSESETKRLTELFEV
jgi:hypothetical protein